MSIAEKIEFLNDMNSSDIHYWMDGNRFFVCYNADEDMDDIHELSEKQMMDILKMYKF